MLAARNVLMSNLNYVHRQHVSLGVHLSRKAEGKEGPVNQDTGRRDVSVCYHHQWKDNTHTTVVDANSNDPSVPCQCCDQHTRQDYDDLEGIMSDDYLSPNDLPLSPLSPSSPSTDSSSSSDFTLDDSPVSMYYKEYSQNALESPDQPDIIPLDVEDSPELGNSTYSTPENVDNNNSESMVSLHWNVASVLDSNCNALVVSQPLEGIPGSSSVMNNPVLETGAQPNTEDKLNAHRSTDEELLPGLSFTETPKKTITSFHELAQKRRKSGGIITPQPKKDRSDWLIVFSPDTEQPPVNELTASAFFHGDLLSQTPALSAGKEVTTFRELRYRNTLNKQGKVHSIGEKGYQPPIMGCPEPTALGNDSYITREQNDSNHIVIKKMVVEDQATIQTENPPGSETGPYPSSHSLALDASIQAGLEEAPQRGWSLSGHKISTLVDNLSAMNGQMGQHYQPNLKTEPSSANDQMTIGGVWNRGLADGGDKRCREGGAPASFSSAMIIRLTNNLRPLYSPQSSAPHFLSWYPSFPPRLSPVGASSPPHRVLIPMLDTPDVSILLSPLFPKNRTHPRPGQEKGAPCTPLTEAADTVSKHTPLMANGDEDFVQRDKKCLLNNIGSAVEKIIAHFNTSRNQVQKTQLGDSRLSPALGYLILNNLCPSLYFLLADGLKPFQKDVIIGQRRLSPWSLVEASSRTGPNSLYNLFNKVIHLQQLRDPQRRFNAFISGLLNMKQLDVWVSHLHQSHDLLSVFFLPNGFLPLAASQPELYEELLLTLQPLSALTFHIDLLFEHHHLQLQDLPTPLRSLNQGQVPVNWGLPSFQQLLDIGGWISHNLSGNIEKEPASPDRQKLTHSSDKGSIQSRDCPQEWSIFGTESMQHPSTQDDTPQTMSSPGTATSTDLHSSNNWWEHLNQASRVYIPSKRDSFSFSALRRLTRWGTSTSENKQDGTPEDRDRSVQNLSYHGDTTSRNEAHSQPDDHSNDPRHSCEVPKPLNSVKGAQPARMPSDHTRHTDDKGHWLGQLFGASSSHGQEMVKSRRPSSWLPPNINVWNLLGKTSTPENPESSPPDPGDPRPERTLRALCDHVAAGGTQLSFRKGDVLQLLGNVDDDWICCRHGGDTGLVPVGYTSLIL